MAITHTDSDPIRVPQAQRGKYALSGIGALLLSVACFGWAVYSAQDIGVGDYVVAVFDGSKAATRSYVDVYHLAQGVALAVSGGLALAGRRVARGALVALLSILVYDSVRQLIALHDDSYREFFLHGQRGNMQILTDAATVVVGLVVVVVMLSASGAAPRGYYPGPAQGGWQQPPSPQPYGPPGGYPQNPPQPGDYGYPQPPSRPPGY
ncbi:hypothetical protein [Wenjunlia tyrosinilytica]|uniref:hypothetical protein n=1 Tax=Wenjunlia tyrosinilytica TaxID=1544741 RepID=UPI0016644B0A|nr:hypothetical protein [Wenjunlia tyrosinilytica]